MDTDRSLSASFWVMMFLQTLGSVDVPSGPRKMPAPRAYVPAIVVWSVLRLAADNGVAERGAATAGWVMVLVSLVLGPSGAKLVNFFNGIANRYGAAPTAPTTGQATATSQQLQPTPA